MSSHTSAVGYEAAAISARLDRLPATRYVWRIVVLLSLGGGFEFYDLFFMTYIGPGLVRSGFFTSASQHFFGFRGFAAFVASTFAGLFLGTLVFGFVADRFGRRAIFTTSLLWYALASVIMAFQHSSSGLLFWRMICGIGIGVEFVTIDAYIAELIPRELRGRAFALNQVIEFAVVPIVAFISWLLVPRHFGGLDGWRWVVLIGSVGAAFVWVIRRRIPESPRWLIARGRLEEAERATTAIENQVAREFGKALPEIKPAAAPESRGNLMQIFRPPYAGRTLMLTAFNFFQTIGYYGFASWVPTLLIAKGIAITSSLHYSFIIAIAAPFGPLAGWAFADKFERKWQIVWSAVCIAAFGLLFARQRSPEWLIACGVLLTCANNWMSFAFHTYQAELFPTRVRAQAVGFVYCWSRLSAILASFLIGFFLNDFGVDGVFALIAASMLVVILAIGVFGPRTRGLALEAISS
ncbi:MAG TPA: MFS transporter [Candidatus Acidoferrales bacterium]|jgi:putative MFS transporter|nr:MFS transporter [Candidatus Acidoferrales bacterium]